MTALAEDRWPAGTKLTFPYRRWRTRQGPTNHQTSYVHVVAYVLGEALPVSMCRVDDVLNEDPPDRGHGLAPCPRCIKSLTTHGLWPLLGSTL